jgi:hypothetical protein
VAFHDLALSLASQIIRGRLVISAVPAPDFPGRSPLFRAASLADALAGCLLGWSEFFQRRYITGVYLIAIDVPFRQLFDFNDLREPK